MSRLSNLTGTVWDVVIIGAGPAGSTLSISLVRRGLRVLLIDQAQFPRSKVCGGCLNENALAALDELGLRVLPTQLGGHRVSGLLFASRGRFARLTLEGVSVSRFTFDNALIAKAVDAGVEFRPGVRASLQAEAGDEATITLREGNETSIVLSRIAVLAHGLQGGIISQTSRLGAGAILDEVPDGYPLHTIAMAVGSGGYVGGVPIENGRYDLAAAFDTHFVQRHATLGHAAVAILHEAGFPPIPHLEDAPWKGTPLLTRRAAHIAGHRWFAVGDATGYVEPFTGEGMAWAMSGANALAPIVCAAVNQWQPSLVESWTRTHARIVTRRQWTCRLLAKVLRSPFATSAVVQVLSHFPFLGWPIVRNLSRPATRLDGVAT